MQVAANSEVSYMIQHKSFHQRKYLTLVIPCIYKYIVFGVPLDTVYGSPTWDMIHRPPPPRIDNISLFSSQICDNLALRNLFTNQPSDMNDH